MKLHIKNMDSLRCIGFVKSALEKTGINYTSIELGLIEIQDDVSEDQLKDFEEAIAKVELKILEDKKSILVERIKNIIDEMVGYSDEFSQVEIEDCLNEKLGYDNSYLSNMFTEVKGKTIEQYISQCKMERVKEFLLYNELDLTEISTELGYGNVDHLTNQFKQITGLTPTYFQTFQEKRLKN